MDLFEAEKKEEVEKEAPLARRMRPRSLKEFVGQEHILGPEKLLRRAIQADRITSLILYGPPGCGKTALTYVIANSTKSHFSQLNAVTSGVADIRRMIEEAKGRRRLRSKKTILFIDEIHRFNKAQQDALMPDVEDGTVTLIGATVHNPYFSINSPLLSRSQIFELFPLSEDELKVILNNALGDKERGLGRFKVKIDKEALEHIVTISDGDARRALNALEVGVLTTQPKDGLIHFTLPVAEESIQRKAIVYDKDGDAHYDTASAFIKSMRGGDPDASLYWLAKMLYAGEDPRFIARRIVICAAEDVGNADPQALVLANAALQISEFVGLPEARIPLAQAVAYIACAPKSNSAYSAISEAMKDVEEGRTEAVPKHLQDSHYPGAAKLNRGKGYKYPHSYQGHFVEQEYRPGDKIYYRPSDEGYEAKIKERLNKWRKKA
ncbi:replication-associated recombination protein A [bacterium]|nr:replication-associated recombination protein A [bacterium]MCK4326795.1 replication-associated recombination protein A [bacterium]